MSVIAVTPGRWLGQMLGHCVALVQRASSVGHTSRWRRGRLARGGNLRRGTVIATFGGTPPRYQNRVDGSSHAAVFCEERADGLVVYDCWRGQVVHKRVIRWRGGRGRASNDGDRFHVVEVV